MRPVTNQERSKYASMWEVDDYHKMSPGELYVDAFFNILKPKSGERVLDVGAGAGAGSKALKQRGLSVQAFDLTDAAWKHDDIKLMTGSVWRDLPHVSPPYNYCYCCDVMEHIPTEFTALSVSEMLRVGVLSFLCISFQEEFYGRYIQQSLHLTIKPFEWWRDMLREVGTVHEARDLMGDGLFVVGR